MEIITLRRISLTIRILYPFWMIIGMVALMYIPSFFYVTDNPAETARNIRSNETLFRLGILANLTTQLLAIIIPILLYWLFSSVSRSQAQLMLLLNLIGVPIAMYGNVHMLQAITMLERPDQMMEHINMSHFGITIAYIFWGLWLFPLGSLSIRSGYFPKIIGYFLYIAGIGYLIGALFAILFPDVAHVSDITEILTIGEVLFILWIVIKGPKLPTNLIYNN